jgi:hypothetical protein
MKCLTQHGLFIHDSINVVTMNGRYDFVNKNTLGSGSIAPPF